MSGDGATNDNFVCMGCFQILRKTMLLDGDYVSSQDNWLFAQQFAQLCYAPTPSLMTQDPCSMANERAGDHASDVFYKIEDN
ncbi:hypothetical protein GUITHDRAFT_112803 [Guillardia theta CCMP2712]|uniref:Uncharacterized protein n=1 Tax=Guillardia theta (strain CCMP2712) TaxID=905079 RepID=L1IY79_GUITC|nr:hypothetical protein GUITHDRAFT_112803 [Guillardia theta CCMP2712]EKX41067.1 hypothetical protein GUITHDRAFT_112803 [Guillardia theta CCMP2712]|eukprot:XP_005828047.1 hypothetical protein GUITHDRAFT_112803 [Guillardia theta CCMP2712]